MPEDATDKDVLVSRVKTKRQQICRLQLTLETGY
jgi:hypothetical protein